MLRLSDRIRYGALGCLCIALASAGYWAVHRPVSAALTPPVPLPTTQGPYRFDQADTTDPDDIAASAVFAQTFTRLVASKSWGAVEGLAPLRQAFDSMPVVSTSEFKTAWRQWELYRLGRQWVIDESGIGLWTLEQSASPDGMGLTLGLRQQPDGRWWLVLLRTREPAGQAPWNCSPTCTISISAGGRRLQLIARPPLGHDWRVSDAIGAPVPLSFLVDRPNYHWQIQPPNPEEPASEFDLSWFPSVCKTKLTACPSD